MGKHNVEHGAVPMEYAANQLQWKNFVAETEAWHLRQTVISLCSPTRNIARVLLRVVGWQ